MAARAGSKGKRPARRADTVMDVTVVLLEAGYASTAVGPIEVFNSAGSLWNWLKGETPRPRFRVRVASLDGRPVTTPCSLGLIPEFSIAQIERTDIVVLPASGWDVLEHIAKASTLVPWLRKMHSRGASLAGICTGVAFIAEAGLLDGREATTHWALADVLRTRYPKVRWRPEQFVTEDGGIFCSGGIYASMDVSLYMVEKFCGHEIALQCAKSLLLSMPRSRQSGYSATPLSPPHADGRILKAEEYLRRHFKDGVSVEAAAGKVAMSPRNFIRRFKAATGRLPGEYVQMLRIAAARDLLEAGKHPVARVCEEVGYGDMAFFRSIFKRHTGMTPLEYRNSFAGMSFERGALVAG